MFPSHDQMGVPALTTGEWPNGLNLFNKGFIMGRGGDGGSFASGKYNGLSWSIGSPSGKNRYDGWDGSDAIYVNTSSRVNINNVQGAIAGGGGGGAGGGTGDFGGGGGGAGGGKGGIGAYAQNYNKLPGELNAWEAGGDGGEPGEPGSDGGNSRNIEGGVSSGLKGSTTLVYLQGRGGEAGGGGAGGYKRGGNDPHGGGGGGGRVLTPNASGGDGGDIVGGS